VAYLDTRANEAVIVASRAVLPGIRLGEPERQVILRAARDLRTGREGVQLDDPRLEALRVYAMFGRERREGAHALLSAGFTAAERRVVDAMIDALPMRAASSRPVTGRLVWASLILLPLLSALDAYGWANLYIEDRLIAFVLASLALLVLAPAISAIATPARRNPYPGRTRLA